jgi:hypothetical protein
MVSYNVMGMTGPTGPTGTALFTLIPSGTTTLLSPNSFILNAVDDEVVSNEQFTVDSNGIYIQTTLPAVTTAGDVLTVGFGGSIVPIGYYLELIEPNTVLFEYAPNIGDEELIFTGSYTPGDTASLYYDGTQMHFYLGGIHQASSPNPIVGAHVFRCQYNTATASATYQFNNVSIFVTGVKGPTGYGGGPNTWVLNNGATELPNYSFLFPEYLYVQKNLEYKYI